MSISAPPTNYTGTALLVLHIQAALYLTSFLVSDLRRLAKAAPALPDAAQNAARRKRLRTFSALAALSLALLSYNMLHGLSASYGSWAAARGAAAWADDVPARLWRWATDSAPFRQLADALVADAAAWWWAQAALLAGMAWSLFMAIEGTRAPGCEPQTRAERRR